MFKEKLGICLYEENYYEEGIIKIQDEDPIKEISKVSTKKSTKALIDESDNESVNESDNKSINKSDNESINEPASKSINKSDNESIIESDNKNTTDWYDKNKFSEILTTIDSNNFNHRNKIGKFKFNDINNLISNIKNNAISEADTKKKINKLIEIKTVETKGKRLIKSQQKLLNLFDDLKTIFNNNNNSNNNENNSNNEKEHENENVNVNENESDDGQYYLEQLNNNFKEIDEIKSFKGQIYISKK